MKYRIQEARNRRGEVEYYYIQAYILFRWRSVKIEDSFGDMEKLRFRSSEEAEKRIEENSPKRLIFEETVKEIKK